MNRRELLKWIVMGVISLSAPSLSIAQLKPPFEEYCFQISPHKTIAMREVDTTPEQFLKKNPNIEAVINGVYFGDSNSQGVAYLAGGYQFATEKPEHIRGYFSVNMNGDKIQVTETLAGKPDDYWLVIGIHPLLITNGKVHSQANEERYDSERFGYRSAIGTKNGRNICFAVSRDKMLMIDWAKTLHNAGYLGAINLDGGPVSQLAVREDKSIAVKGKGNANTRLVIFSYRK